MTKSDSIKELASALSKAQGAIRGALKDRTNPHFKSQYADLSSVWEACRAQLAANGIAVIQGVESEGGAVRVETTLAHLSGEWITSSLTLPVAQASAQGVGSAITYGRRYGLSAMVGIAPTDDDDGEAASHPAPRYEAPTPAAKPAPAAAAQTLAQTLWARAVKEWGQDAKREWEAATIKALGAPVSSKNWSDDQTKMVEKELFRNTDIPL